MKHYSTQSGPKLNQLDIAFITNALRQMMMGVGLFLFLYFLFDLFM